MGILKKNAPVVLKNNVSLRVKGALRQWKQISLVKFAPEVYILYIVIHTVVR